MSTLPADVLARRIEQIADRLEGQVPRHRESGDRVRQFNGDPFYHYGIADAKEQIAERLRAALEAPEPTPADHHTGTEDAAGRHSRYQPTGQEWLVAHKDDPDQGDAA